MSNQSFLKQFEMVDSLNDDRDMRCWRAHLIYKIEKTWIMSNINCAVLLQRQENIEVPQKMM